MAGIPQDPVMLYSYLNTLLRDRYGSLSELCEDLELSETKLRERLSEAGFQYQPEKNRFV